MALKLKTNEPLRKGVHRIVRDEADRIAKSLEERRGHRQPEAVHEARKSVKKIRALLRLIADAIGQRTWQKENRIYRKIGRDLSPLRDSEILQKTTKKLRAERKKQISAATFTSVLKLFAARRNCAANDLCDSLTKVRKRSRKAAKRIEDWPLKGLHWDDLYCGLQRTYQQGQDAFATACARPDDDSLHEWRKQVKDLWYDLQILHPAWPKATGPMVHQVEELGEILGDDHDLAMLGAVLQKEQLNKGAIKALLSLIKSRRSQLQRVAFDSGRRLFVEKANAFARRIETRRSSAD